MTVWSLFQAPVCQREPIDGARERNDGRATYAAQHQAYVLISYSAAMNVLERPLLTRNRGSRPTAADPSYRCRMRIGLQVVGSAG